MLEPASRRLIEHASRYNFARSTVGVALDDIAHVPISEDVRADILRTLDDPEPAENLWGLFFCRGLLAAGRAEEAGLEVANTLMQRLPYWISCRDAGVRMQALPVYVRYRENFPDFVSSMEKLLTDSDAEVRMLALQNAPAFLSRRSAGKLLIFQSDTFASEEKMGGPMVYALRNMGLEQIERLVGRRFPSSQLSEVVEGRTIAWRDSQPFLDWWQLRQRGWRRWLLSDND